MYLDRISTDVDFFVRVTSLETTVFSADLDLVSFAMIFLFLQLQRCRFFFNFKNIPKYICQTSFYPKIFSLFCNHFRFLTYMYKVYLTNF